ncbi:hypothetical protein ABZ820_36730 [Streptomyces diacarni]|uniref:hypothetical protein n=1 Tax=Streptomyces diacarni TaxID=2800381 RepID=UPI0033EA54AB
MSAFDRAWRPAAQKGPHGLCEGSRGHVEALPDEPEVKLGVFLSNNKSRRAKLTVDKLAALAGTGMGGHGGSSVRTAHAQDTGKQEISAAPRQRVGDYQTMATGARVRVHAALGAAGVELAEAEELVCALELG